MLTIVDILLIFKIRSKRKPRKIELRLKFNIKSRRCLIHKNTKDTYYVWKNSLFKIDLIDPHYTDCSIFTVKMTKIKAVLV